MSALFDRYPGEVRNGKDITIGNVFPEFFISDMDEVFCYTGIYLENDQHHSIFMHPYYMMGKRSDDKRFAKEIKAFFRIADGCIVLDEYVDSARSERSYKKIDAYARLPVAADIYYGVMINQVEDEDFTRAVFGVTCKELSLLLEVYAKTIGIYNDYCQYPRLTRSVRSSNYCDLTRTWIPEQFPYIAFDQSSYDFSHVSLWGFYRHLQLMTFKTLSSTFSRVLLNAGIDEGIMKRLFSIGDSCYYQEIVSRDTWRVD